MTPIIPAVLEKKFDQVRRRVEQVEALGCPWVQLDVSDGLFTPDYSWENWQDLETLDGRIKLEVHLMVEQPELYLKDWLRVADRVLVHPEATKDLGAIIKQFEHTPGQLGLALLLETPLEVLDTLDLAKIKVVQLMGIREIGRQGEPFDLLTVERVKNLRARRPSVTISVDGGVNLANAASLIRAGANHLVVGSALWSAKDPAAALRSFQDLLK